MKTDKQLIAQLQARIRLLERALVALEQDYQELKNRTRITK